MMFKKGAMEMSIGTIVVLVLAISMLVLGIVFVRGIMCSGIQISEEMGEGVKNQIRDLFTEDRYGVACAGEGDQDITVGTGGRRKIVCIIKSEDSEQYQISASVESLEGAPTSTVQKWILDEGWKGTVVPGGDGTEAVALVLDIPQDAPQTTLKVIFTSMKVADPESRSTHISYLDITPVGYFQTTMC